MSFPAHPTIIVGGGLAGLAAAHQAYNRGSNVVLLDKQGFLSGNSGKATSGINGSLTRTQVSLGIKDSVDQFYDDTLATAKDRANPELIKVLTYHSAEAIHWLQEHFQLDLSVVSRLGGHSQPRTHRGRDSKFPGMAITYKLLETLEALAESDPSRVVILKHTQVIDLVTEQHRVLGVKFKNLKTKEKGHINGPVIMCTGGYAADFTKNSLLRKYRPDILDLPSTNGVHATGDGQKIMMKHKGVGIDMDKVQVHPTGLIDLDDNETIEGKKHPRFLFLGAEALRGEGGIMLNSKGERFVDELGTRDYVSGEMEKQIAAGNGPIRLVLSSESEKKLSFHIKHYKSRNLMKTITGAKLAQEIGCSQDQVARVLDAYNKAASGESADQYGKKYFPNTPFVYRPEAQYHVSFVTRVLHFTMGGIKINDKTQVVYANGDKFVPFEGLYAAGEVAGGVHGHNRLGGSSLLACVVFGRLAADQACSYLMHKMSMARLKMVQVHLDGQPRVVVDYGDGQNSQQTENNEPQPTESSGPQPTGSSGLEIPNKEFTPEEVAKHNTADDCWVIIKNVVLDLTSFLKDHPGGEHSITTYAGKDATESFDMLHDDSFIRKYTSECVLGRLKGEKIKLDTSK